VRGGKPPRTPILRGATAPPAVPDGANSNQTLDLPRRANVSPKGGGRRASAGVPEPRVAAPPW
jgi:hypothetical protein